MNKIILQAKNKEELELLIKSNITLQEDETYLIKELKRPFNFFFINLKGKYEITILKKEELEKVKKESKKEVNIAPKTVKIKEKKEIKKENSKPQEDITKKIKNTFMQFVEKTELHIEIESIKLEGNVVLLNVEGKDVRYLIGEKGIALNSLECLFNSIKDFRGYRIQLDSNNYKAKREDTLKNIAQKKAEKVLKTKTNCKLSPMTARERRIIHEEISNYPNLRTESYGEEPKRFLVIKYIGEKED